MEKRIKTLSFLTTLMMLFVLIGGAIVTKTDSGKACGDTWPLCHGEFIPAFTISKFIEYSHRYVSGAAGLLLLATTILVWIYIKRKDAKWFSAGAGLFTIIQAYLGAMAALSEPTSIVKALHFGISLIAFAFTLLLWLVFTKWGNYNTAEAAQSLRKMSLGFAAMIWGTLIFTYVAVYFGAYVRHTESSGGCSGWPLCNGEIIPELTGATGVIFTHRVIALALLLYTIVVVRIAVTRFRDIEQVRIGAWWALGLLVAQIFSGASVTFTLQSDWYLVTALIHAVLISGLFAILSYLCVLTIYAHFAQQLNVSKKNNFRS
ncbi:COX15/CtaA family protein [Paenibacillus sp. N1-5-1-14]|uniref:COX15/CtaA family protein n=1 Tax=Paenibacillus radicibacter TaxID=2972488 RepID=UPI002159A279|nr:COX15/CtaA family protein [Paenibacillus radicibacter]MCR8645291.1 COX15/CtaA family protein [Paenibacillus radicibacter]